MNERSSILKASIVVAVADAGVALLAGLAIFPLVFANDLSPAEGTRADFRNTSRRIRQYARWLNPRADVLRVDGDYGIDVSYHYPGNHCFGNRRFQHAVTSQNRPDRDCIALARWTRYRLLVQQLAELFTRSGSFLRLTAATSSSPSITSSQTG